MPSPVSPWEPSTLPTGRPGLLPAPLRRDLADINAEYLELGLLPGKASDPRFAWSEPVRACLAATDPATRARMAAAPFALFNVVLPATLPTVCPPRVEDGVPTRAADLGQGRYLSFAHQAMFLAWRLVEGSPLAARLVLGLSPAGEARLRELRPSQIAQVTEDPGLIRPRWPRHTRFWAVLAGAAGRESPAALRWAHCIGLCLLGTDDAAAPAPEPVPRRGGRR